MEEQKLMQQPSGLPRKQNLDAYNKIVGEKPDKYKAKPHPMITVQKVVKGQKVKVPLEYYEIGFVEAQLDRIFNGLWNTEVLETKLIANSIVVVVKLWYFNPAVKIWQFRSGIGAAPLQTDQGAGATEFDRIKSAAVTMAAPSAKAYAVKNAAQQVGNAFGRHLNREFDFDYRPDERMDTILTESERKENERIAEYIESATSREQLQEVEPHLKTEEQKEKFNAKQQKLKL